MLFSYIKKTTLLAVSLVAAFSMQQVVFGESFKEESEKVEVIIQKINETKLDDMLNYDEQKMSLNYDDLLSKPAKEVWSEIKGFKTNLKVVSKSKVASQALTAAFFFAKVSGSLMLNYAKEFFGDLKNFDNTDTVILDELNTYITKGLNVVGCRETSNDTMACEAVVFKKSDMGMDALVTSIADIMTKARNILVVVKTELASDRCGSAFLLSQFKLVDKTGYTVENNDFITVGSYIKQTLKKIEKDISDTLRDLSEGILGLIKSGITVTDNLKVNLEDCRSKAAVVADLAGNAFMKITAEAMNYEDKSESSDLAGDYADVLKMLKDLEQ